MSVPLLFMFNLDIIGHSVYSSTLFKQFVFYFYDNYVFNCMTHPMAEHQTPVHHRRVEFLKSEVLIS